MHVNLGTPKDIIGATHSDNSIFFVAAFHTHPPVLNCFPEREKRVVGPSGPDDDGTYPGILYDFRGYDFRFVDNDDEYELYYYGKNRRE